VRRPIDREIEAFPAGDFGGRLLIAGRPALRFCRALAVFQRRADGGSPGKCVAGLDVDFDRQTFESGNDALRRDM